MWTLEHWLARHWALRHRVNHLNRARQSWLSAFRSLWCFPWQKAQLCWHHCLNAWGSHCYRHLRGTRETGSGGVSIIQKQKLKLPLVRSGSAGAQLWRWCYCLPHMADRQEQWSFCLPAPTFWTSASQCQDFSIPSWQNIPGKTVCSVAPIALSWVWSWEKITKYLTSQPILLGNGLQSLWLHTLWTWSNHRKTEQILPCFWSSIYKYFLRTTHWLSFFPLLWFKKKKKHLEKATWRREGLFHHYGWVKKARAWSRWSQYSQSQKRVMHV